MTDLVNWMPDMDWTLTFEKDYQISGVPRYLVIDKEGNLIAAFASPPGDGEVVGRDFGTMSGFLSRDI